MSRHLDALPETERAGYQAGAALATKLAATTSATDTADTVDLTPADTTHADTTSVPAVV